MFLMSRIFLLHVLPINIETQRIIWIKSINLIALNYFSHITTSERKVRKTLEATSSETTIKTG